ncbi:hypothetical protein KJ898_02665 [bacterium]|nr:hypothetical protein [bacterium]MBU2439477.1 hypothetical protein [bacterium]
MSKLMKITKLKNYGIPSYIVNIWEKHYSPCLLPLQEDAVRNYGILDCGEGSDEIASGGTQVILSATLAMTKKRWIPAFAGMT